MLPVSDELTRQVGILHKEISSALSEMEQSRGLGSNESMIAKTKYDSLRTIRERFYTMIALRNHLEPDLWEALIRTIRNDSFERLVATQSIEAFVVSLDIRRSTTLMLNAKDPEAFAHFIFTLCSRLRQIIWDNQGIFEKFTGDGILACFPPKFTGENAALATLKAAEECLRAYKEIYENHRDDFHVVNPDLGLGIGIDFGPVFLGLALAGLTIVGRPVVYACRLSSAESGRIAINQQAKKKMSDCLHDGIEFEDIIVPVKNELAISAYSAKIKNDIALSIIEPGWKKYFC